MRMAGIASQENAVAFGELVHSTLADVVCRVPIDLRRVERIRLEDLLCACKDCKNLSACGQTSQSWLRRTLVGGEFGLIDSDRVIRINALLQLDVQSDESLFPRNDHHTAMLSAVDGTSCSNIRKV